MLASPHASAPLVSNTKFDTIITEMDYYAHLTYQASFSTRQLGSTSADYPGFIIDKDGLPSPGKKSNNRTFSKSDFPSFPLASLMDFFKGVNSGGKAKSVTTDRVIEEIPLFLLLLFVIPGLFMKRKNDKSPRMDFSGFRKFSSNFRLKGKRKKVYSISGKNQERILKDA